MQRALFAQSVDQHVAVAIISEVRRRIGGLAGRPLAADRFRRRRAFIEDLGGVHVDHPDRQRVAFHHERATRTVVDRTVVHTELAGAFVLPPARAELMYSSRVRGHSSAFHFRVAPASAAASK